METKAGLNIAGEGNVAIASFSSTCISDVEELRQASSHLRKYVETQQPQRMIFDFDGVKFFSSQVLGLLLEARAYLRPHNGEVAIASLSPQLQRVFKITNLEKTFRFFPDRVAALHQATGGLD